jgi:multiple sugar transport system substrate-binding protein
MAPISRGEFLWRGALAGGGLLAAPALLAACGSEGRGAGGAELAVGDGERAEVGYYFIETPPTAEAIRKLASSFEKANSNITVRPRGIAGGSYATLTQQLQAALAAGNPPAVSQVGYGELRYVAASLPHLDIEEAAGRDPDGDGMRLLTGNFPANILDLGRVDGKLQFVPYSVSTPVLWYNEDALDRAGVRAPARTWDEVRDHARRISEETDEVGLAIGEARIWEMQAAMESNGARVLVEEGGGFRCEVDGPEAVEAMELLAGMVLQDKSATYSPGVEGIENFARGRAGMLVTSSAALGLIGQAGFPFGAAPFPTFGDKPRRVPAGGHNLGIFAEDETQQAAGWRFIKYLLSPEALTTWLRSSTYVAIRNGLADDPRYLKPYYEENPAARAGLEQLEGVVPWVSFPGGSGQEAAQVLVDAFDRIFAGEQEVAPALEEAARRINELIQD